MVLVDTSVWIDFLGGRDSGQVVKLERLIEESEDICTCGVILTEVLQGIREDSDYARTLSRFNSFLYLEMRRGTFFKAAQLYRSLRRRGLTVSKPVDCMIAAVAIEHNVVLLHNDKDFEPIAEHCGLRVLEV
ncbi:MAG: PIN domain nuclease [Acidobacteria bacterium]|nr:PIN domain nuclease [Acidobacteriota bacterium]